MLGPYLHIDRARQLSGVGGQRQRRLALPRQHHVQAAALQPGEACRQTGQEGL